MKANAYSGDLIKIEKYEVTMEVQTTREVVVAERITVKFLQGGLTMFYRSLPKEGCSYKEVQATCAGNDAFYYDVIDNPDMSGFIDVECIGNVYKGAIWTYDITYVMTPNEGKTNGMIIDVIGYGWSVPLYDVDVEVHFPEKANINAVYCGEFGTSEQAEYTLSEDGKRLFFHADELEMTYTSVYNERMAKGVTVDFTLPAGVLDGYVGTRIFTENMWKLLLGALVCVGIALFVFLVRPRREMITTVHIKPPKDMSPLLMGKILDGSVDNEDITSMIYYFAHKGYLHINLEDEDDPELIRRVEALPEGVPAHEKTLFNGLFAEGKVRSNGFCCVKCSQLVTKFYEATEKAKLQTQPPKPMYERKSVFGFVLGGIVGFLFALLGGYLMGKRIGGGYSYFFGGFLLLPIAVNLFLGYIRENYRYKWKWGKRFGMLLAQLGVSAACIAIFSVFFAHHFTTGWERLVLCLGGVLPSLITQATLSRTEKYTKVLGDILGFKQFIVATEEDKIKFMLEENPELYYEVLPYAQVLGVTDEWEEKFANITLAPPAWCVGYRMTVFDYMLINRSLRVSMMRGMAEATKKASGGGHIGFGGGGGSFGGFGGGGFGGGGGGAR